MLDGHITYYLKILQSAELVLYQAHHIQQLSPCSNQVKLQNGLDKRKEIFLSPKDKYLKHSLLNNRRKTYFWWRSREERRQSYCDSFECSRNASTLRANWSCSKVEGSYLGGFERWKNKNKRSWRLCNNSAVYNSSYQQSIIKIFENCFHINMKLNCEFCS